MKDGLWLFPEDETICLTFDPIHHLHFGIEKLFKICFGSSFWSVTLCFEESWGVQYGKLFGDFKGNMLPACTRLLALSEKKFQITRLRNGLLIVEVSLQLKGLFNSDVVPRMLEGKDYHSIEMVFYFNLASGDKDTVVREDE